MNRSLDLIERLCQAVRALTDPPPPPGWNHAEIDDLLGPAPRRPAAVLVGFVAREAGPSLLFTRRTEHLVQHAGQVSFPGGGIEAHDRDPVAAALRESEEELGISARSIRPIGYLDRFDTISGYSITPVVAELAGNYQARPNPGEVAAVFEAPLAFFLDAANRRMRRLRHRGRERRVFEYHYAGHMIWGATAAMLLNLAERLERAGCERKP
jgi:8-oxo-dGTP pyrophosphatase MutT (NUDIX family)